MIAAIAVFPAFGARRVADSILGVHIGSDIDEVREKLDRLAVEGNRGEGEGEAEEGQKVAWLLRGTEFKSIALQTDRAGKVVWVTGFLRKGREIPFARLGPGSQATRYTSDQAIWNVRTNGGGYRLVAKGSKQKAGVVYLLSFPAPRE